MSSMNSKTTSVSVADFEIDMEKKDSYLQEDAFSNPSDFEDLELILLFNFCKLFIIIC